MIHLDGKEGGTGHFRDGIYFMTWEQRAWFTLLYDTFSFLCFLIMLIEINYLEGIQSTYFVYIRKSECLVSRLVFSFQPSNLES